MARLDPSKTKAAATACNERMCGVMGLPGMGSSRQRRLARFVSSELQRETQERPRLIAEIPKKEKLAGCTGLEFSTGEN
jgi:hypothetical protein